MQRLRYLLLLLASVNPIVTELSAAVPPRTKPGWAVELVAEAPTVKHPSVVCSAPDGRIFVAEDPMDISLPDASARKGRIVCLHPDGKSTTFAEGLFAVFGLQYLEGKLYVLHNPKFTVFDDSDGIGANPVELIEQTNPEPWALNWNDHVPANFRLGMDGYFYIAVGDKGLYGAIDRGGQRVDMQGGGIVRIRPDGTGLEVFCRGVRNIMDVAINSDDELFTYDNTDEHHWMGRLTHMVDGGFYGYPFDFVPRRAYTLWMFADYGAGAAAGTLCYNEDAWPDRPDAAFRGNLFLADFGQRNIRRVLIDRAGGTYRAVSDEQLFLEPPGDFRPVGITESHDGRSIYICDWQHVDNKETVTVGRLWRLSRTDATDAAPRPKWYVEVAMGRAEGTSSQELVAALSHPARSVRMAAQRELSRQGNGNYPELLRLLEDDQQPSMARIHALWAIHAIDQGVRARPAILKLAPSPRPAIARQAIRQIGLSRNKEALPVLAIALKNVDAAVRFHAATALRRIQSPDAMPQLIERLNDPDDVARFAVFTALNKLASQAPESRDAWRQIIKALDSANLRTREAAGFALRETYDTALVRELTEFSAAEGHAPEARAACIQLLGEVYKRRPAWKGEWWAYHPALAEPPARTLEWEGTQPILQALTTAISDPFPSVRLAGIDALASNHERSRSPQVIERFQAEQDGPVRQAILRACGVFKDPAAGPLLARALRSETDSQLVIAALEAVGALATNAPADLHQIIVEKLRAGPASFMLPTLLHTAADVRAVEAIPQITHFAESGNESARAAAIRALVQIKNDAAVEALASLTRASSVDARQRAVAALGQLKAPSTVPVLLEAFSRPETRTAATEALAKIPDARALEAHLEALASPNPPLREQAAKALAAVRADVRSQIESRASSLPAVSLTALRTIYETDAQARNGPLFATEAQVAAPADYERFASQNPGEAPRGKLLFFDSAGVACSNCHSVNGQGGKVGPDLSNIGAQFSRPQIIEAILYPSKAVREGYEQYRVETRGGEEVAGSLRSENAERLILVDATGREHTIPKQEIANSLRSSLSLMPEGLHLGLSLRQFADLITYCASLKTESPPSAK